MVLDKAEELHQGCTDVVQHHQEEGVYEDIFCLHECAKKSLIRMTARANFYAPKENTI